MRVGDSWVEVELPENGYSQIVREAESSYNASPAPQQQSWQQNGDELWRLLWRELAPENHSKALMFRRTLASAGHAAGACVGKEADEVDGLVAPPAICFESEGDKAAASVSAQLFRVGALLASSSDMEGRSGRVSSVKAGATCDEGRDQGDIDGKLRAATQWEAVSDDFDPIDRDVEVGKPDVGGPRRDRSRRTPLA